MSAMKKYPRGVERIICGGAGCARTPTYTGPLLAVDLFSVESLNMYRLEYAYVKVRW